MGISLDGGGKWRVPQWATLNSKKLLQKVHNMLMSAGFFGGQKEYWCALLFFPAELYIWRIWKSVTGIWSRGLFSARFRSVPSSTIVLSLDDEAAAGLCVHSPDSVPHVDYTV